MNQTDFFLVWSFTDSLAEIPYRIYKIGSKIKCNCPSFTKRHATTCKHIKTLEKQVKNKNINSDKFTMLDAGKLHFKI